MYAWAPLWHMYGPYTAKYPQGITFGGFHSITNLFLRIMALSIGNISLQGCYSKCFTTNSHFPLKTHKVSPTYIFWIQYYSINCLHLPGTCQLRKLHKVYCTYKSSCNAYTTAGSIISKCHWEIHQTILSNLNWQHYWFQSFFNGAHTCLNSCYPLPYSCYYKLFTTNIRC